VYLVVVQVLDREDMAVHEFVEPLAQLDGAVAGLEVHGASPRFARLTSVGLAQH
jgi:hypothetical protein